jgi:hypothetical protein
MTGRINITAGDLVFFGNARFTEQNVEGNARRALFFQRGDQRGVPVAVPGPAADFRDRIVGNFDDADTGVRRTPAADLAAVVVGDELEAVQRVELKKKEDENEDPEGDQERFPVVFGDTEIIR